ncbi:hypothetical protein C8F04DRAFT_1281195 [Mycena alexandri]|uniref:CCHC-type domain-containing protein n=1 Tax=Mycena alexandri TaxID=1745969 RepID=A0AAD6RWJ3_9AGAR|nr:hypothetical protein C8F04DRAFT_1281195 [Mycena alexandri]
MRFDSEAEQRAYEAALDPEEYQQLLEFQRRFEEEGEINVGPQAGPSHGHRKENKKKGKHLPRYRSNPTTPNMDPEDSDGQSSGSSPSSLSSSGKPEKPERMPPPPPHSFSAPLRTTYDMPIRGSKEAPKTFRGKYTDVQRWVDHYEQLLNKCRITNEQEKCENILAYCSIDVQNVIQTMESFERSRWPRLRKEILRHFDAERVYQKYKPADVEKYAMKKRQEACYSLTQWRKYFVKYNSIAGGPLTKGYLSREDYNAYFLIGIQRPLRQILENRILQSNPNRNDEAQYTIREINEAAEWYFRRNRYESLMIRAADLGEELDDDYSGNESDNEASGSDDEESDYEEFMRKKKQRAKKKKLERTTKKLATKKMASDKSTQKFQGNEDEIAGMIRKLYAMRLDDPEYAPIFYKVMVMDQTGTAGKCVKPPVVDRGESTRLPLNRPPMPRQGPDVRPPNPTSYPNNIPLGTTTAGGANSTSAPGCFGCDEPGHRISECRRIQELLAKGVLGRGEDGRHLVMGNGGWIGKNTGESLVTAAERIAAANAPRVMLNFVDEFPGYESYNERVSHFYQLEERTEEYDSDPGVKSPEGGDEEPWLNEGIAQDRRTAVSNFYRAEARRARIEEMSSDEESGGESQRVYVTRPREVAEASVQVVERTEPSTRRARQLVFDGVYPPRRDRSQMREVKDLQKEGREEEAPVSTRTEPVTALAPPPPQLAINKGSTGKLPAKPTTRSSSPAKDAAPDIQPFEARRVRFTEDDIEMEDTAEGRKKRFSRKKSEEPVKANTGRQADSEENKLVVGRQSELSPTVSKQAVMDRIMDVQIPMSLRELIVTSKEIRTEIQDLIKVKNVRAVLLGSVQHHPLIANLNWPREEQGVLIKIGMTTNGKQVCAIIDTGSQLDVVRSDIAALFIGRSVDMSQVTNMKDANGGKGQLQGQIHGVEFNCGGAVTSANLWVSQKAPFELLLGRPWQRGNLVSIDERTEGTYLIFKDRETRKPRYELLAVPYDGPIGDFRSGGASQYQTFTLLKEDESVTLSSMIHKKKTTSACLTEKGNTLESDSSRADAAMKRSWDQSERLTRLVSAAELAGASLNLLHAFVEVWAYISFLFLSRAAKRVNKGPAGRVYKKEERLTEDPATPTRLFQLLMSLSRNPAIPLPFPAPSETFQYLSRLTFSEPPVPIVRISAIGPVETVVDAVSRQWQKVANNQPIDVDPTFCAAPQSEYYGSVTLPNGQELHRSSAQNVFRVFRNRTTGLPYTLSCHEFTFHLATPRNPQQTWSLELVYPNDQRLHEAMRTMSPLDPADDVGFPVHATPRAPPMISMAERTRLPVNSSVRPEDTQTTRQPVTTHRALSALSLDNDILQDETRAQRQSLLSQEETFHNAGTECTAHGERVYASPFSTSYDDLLDLDPISSESSEEPGVCGFCFEPQHGTARDCPLYGPRTRRTFDASAFNAVAQLAVGAGSDAEIMPTIDEGAEEGMSEESDESFSIEMRRVLDVAIGPTIREWMGVPQAEQRVFRSLEALVKEARAAFDMYTNDTALRLADMREQNRLQLERDKFSDPLERQMAVESGRLLEELERTNRREQQQRVEQAEAKLMERTLAMQVRVRMEEERERKADDPNYIGAFSPLDRHATSSLNSSSDSYPAHPSPLATSTPRCGRIITRDHWSSSDSATSDSYSHSYDEISIPPFSESGERLLTMDHESWSPAHSEWSVGAFIVNPTWIIDDALDRMHTRSLAEDESSTGIPASTRNSSSTRSCEASVVSEPLRPSTIPLALQEALAEWVEEGAEHRRTTNHYEEEMVCDPGRQAMEILHGSLAKFVDYAAMAAEGVELLRTQSSLGVSPPSSATSSVSDSEPNPTHAATSLDFTLPSRHRASAQHADADTDTSPATNTQVATDAIAVGFEITSMRGNGLKRKRSEDEEGGFRRRKKFPLVATGLTDSRIIELFGGVRLGILETIRRVEEMALYRFEVDERSFPAFFTHHPLLHDFEAAKLQVLANILQRQGCEGPATLLYEILAIRLRDEYAVSHLLNAGYLDDNFPEETSRYWELMGVFPDRLDPEDRYRLSENPGRQSEDDSDLESDSSAAEPTDHNYAGSGSVDMQRSLMYPSLRDERPPTGLDDSSVIDPAPSHDASPSPGPLLYPTDEGLANRAAQVAQRAANSPDTRLIKYAAPNTLSLPEFLRARGQFNVDLDDPVAFRAACVRAGIEQRTHHADGLASEARDEDVGDRSDDEFVVLEHNALGLRFD